MAWVATVADAALASAEHQIVAAFFDPDTFAISYMVADPETGAAAIVASVLDYDPSSGRAVVTCRWPKAETGSRWPAEEELYRWTR